MQTHTTEPSPYVRPAAAASLIGGGLSTLWMRAKKDETFPKPIKLTPKTTVFRRAELIAWVESKATKEAA